MCNIQFFKHDSWWVTVIIGLASIWTNAHLNVAAEEHLEDLYIGTMLPFTGELWTGNDAHIHTHVHTHGTIGIITREHLADLSTILWGIV